MSQELMAQCATYERPQAGPPREQPCWGPTSLHYPSRGGIIVPRRYDALGESTIQARISMHATSYKGITTVMVAGGPTSS